jgi:hypothetical protein
MTVKNKKSDMFQGGHTVGRTKPGSPVIKSTTVKRKTNPLPKSKKSGK